MSKTFSCRKIAKGCAEGEVILSKDAVCFYTVEPETGTVIERDHDLQGQNLAGKILVMPSGKGSSVVQADGLYKLQLHGKEPLAIVVEHADTVLVASAIIMKTPMVHKVNREFYECVQNGGRVRIDADSGTVTVY